MASQLQNYLVLSSPFVALWILIFAGLIEMPEWLHSFSLYYLPFIGVFLFGLYALYTVLHGALNISDCVDAQRELQREMKDTREELAKRNIIDAYEVSKDEDDKNK